MMLFEISINKLQIQQSNSLSGSREPYHYGGGQKKGTKKGELPDQRPGSYIKNRIEIMEGLKWFCYEDCHNFQRYKQNFLIYKILKSEFMRKGNYNRGWDQKRK